MLTDISQHMDRPLDSLPDEEILDPSALGNITENADGSATVEDIAEDVIAERDFYENIAETLAESELSTLSSDLLELIELDKESRTKRDEQYREGLRRTGLGDDAPGGAQFQGASKVVHPLLAEACIDFSARTMKELCPPRGPVRSHVPGKNDAKMVEKAELKAKVLNWQLTTQMREYREEMEQVTTQEPMGGSQYMKFWHDAEVGRHRCEFVPVDMLLLPYSASGLYSSERVTQMQDITRQTFEARVESGLYREVAGLNIDSNDAYPELTKTAEANEKIEGKSETAYNEDGLRRVYEIYAFWKLGADEKTLPYVIHIDDYSEEVLGIYRNWEEEDEKCEKLDWIVEYKFIPWRGAYGIGLPHLIGGISGALTGALRALLDSAHINNAATMLKLKGVRGSGENTTVEITQVTEIDAPPQIDDVRKLAMPMPFNPPSPVLFQLLGFLTDAGKGVVGTAEERIADASNSMPVGTTLALIEQGSQVYASIHTRHHYAQKRALDIICRLNRMYPETLEDAAEALNEQIPPDMFDDITDVEPVSDPNIFSETQRYAQIQAVQQMTQDQRVQWNMKAFYKIAMERMKFDQADDILPEDHEPQKADPVNENVFATKGLPLAAFIDQDHIAHITVHLMFCVSPLFGGNPMLTVPTVPALLEHCKEHFSMLYSQHTGAAVSAITEIHGAASMDEAGMARGVGSAVALAERELATQLAPIMQMLQQAQQMSMAAAPKPPMDPASQVALQLGQSEIQRKTQLDQATLQMNGAAMQAKNAAEQAKQQMAQMMAQQQEQRDTQQQQFDQMIAAAGQERLDRQQQFDAQVQAMASQREAERAQQAQQIEIQKNEADNRQKQLTELLKNESDNETAKIIEAMRQHMVGINHERDLAAEMTGRIIESANPSGEAA